MLEEYLYRKLMRSRAFHRYVRTIYAYVNGLPPPHVQDRYDDTTINQYDYLFKPTRYQRFNAYRKVFADEWLKAFGFRK